MKRDDFPFRNVYSPQAHKLCRDPLCLTCLIAERDNYQPLRWLSTSNMPTGQRLYVVRRQEEKNDAA